MSRASLLTWSMLLICWGMSVSGCQSLSSVQSGFAQSLLPNGGRENPGDDAGDPWIHDAGTIARSEHTAEEVNDPLGLREIFMSRRARSIERNLGVGE